VAIGMSNQLVRDLLDDLSTEERPGAPWWQSPVLFPRFPIPLKYRITDPQRLKLTKSVRIGRDFAGDDVELGTKLVAIKGGVGVGKTVGLVESCRISVQGHGCDQICFFEFGDLISRLLGPERRVTLEAIRECDVAFIDDVGASYMPPLALGLFEEIVLYREARYYSMLVTTNLSPETFKRTFGARVYDRWRGSGCWFDVGDGPSLRTKGRTR
jgi:hypothetical protein